MKPEIRFIRTPCARTQFIISQSFLFVKCFIYFVIRFFCFFNSIKSITAYLFLTNLTAIEYIRNASKRVRKKESAIILASQNIEDFLIDGIREYTKPLFSIPTHQFLFNAGNINPREYMDALQIEESEFDLIKFPERGVCLFKCGNERYLLQVIAPEYKAALFGKAGGR